MQFQKYFWSTNSLEIDTGRMCVWERERLGYSNANLIMYHVYKECLHILNVVANLSLWIDYRKHGFNNKNANKYERGNKKKKKQCRVVNLTLEQSSWILVRDSVVSNRNKSTLGWYFSMLGNNQHKDTLHLDS